MDKQQLIKDNLNLVYFVIHTYYPNHIKDEDLIQCGMVGLCRAADSWDSEKCAFSTFATKCINNEIKNEFRARKKHPQSYSLDHKLFDDAEGGHITLGDTLIGSEDVDWVDVDNIYSSLSEQEREVVKFKLLGLNPGEIADTIGISQQTSSKHLRNAKLRLEKRNEH